MKHCLATPGGDAIPAQEHAATVAVVNGEPTLGGGTTPLAALVNACHETSIDRALAAIPSLDRQTLEPVLTYCAERRCVADAATCPGCRRRTEAEGLVTFDDFVAAHREIIAGNIRLCGPGKRSLTVPSLDGLAKAWAGEEYWFWARRVLRKLRHGRRRAHIQGAATNGADDETPIVILMEPQLADNIGMAARAMANFGLDALRLVNPRDGWPNEKARIAASGANSVVDDAQAFGDLSASVADLHWFAATTARQRDLRKPVLTPEQAVEEMRTRIAAGQRCGVLFGRERNGLTTSEVANADVLVMIPVNSAFASLNLGQAVLLVAYEWMRASPTATLGRVTTYEKPVASGLNLGSDRPAEKADLLGLFEHLERTLDEAGFFNPPEKRSAFVQNLRTTLTRLGATEQEVRTLRGIVATLAKGGSGSGKRPA